MYFKLSARLKNMNKCKDNELKINRIIMSENVRDY